MIVECKMHFRQTNAPPKTTAQRNPSQGTGTIVKRTSFSAQHFRDERGMSLVETIIGLLVLTIVLLAAAQLLRVQVQHLALTERARFADTQADSALNSLSSFNQSALPDVNPFAGKSPTQAISDGDQLSLDVNVCATTYSCDKQYRVPQSSGTGYDYIRVPWNTPFNGTLIHYRTWRVTTIDPAKSLRRITVAIIPADLDRSPTDPVEPLALRNSDVVQRP